jgi:hypothetical protein
MAAGSGGLPGAARNMIVITELPDGMFDNVEKGSSEDVIYLGACKSNVNKEWNMKLFPVLKDTVSSTLRTADMNGVPLMQSDVETERQIQTRLRTFIKDLVAAGSSLRKPFSALEKNKFSIPNLCTVSGVCTSREFSLRA